jgi:hypothetical protein
LRHMKNHPRMAVAWNQAKNQMLQITKRIEDVRKTAKTARRFDPVEAFAVAV